MNPRALRGVIAAAATPLGEDLAPDVVGLVRHCRDLLRRGCDAVLCLGTTGEACSFSVEERLALIRGLGEAGLGPSLMLGIGSCAVPDAVRLARAALEVGAHHLLCLPPFYYKKVSDEGLCAAFSAVIEGVADPRLRLYLYHIPRTSGVPLSRGLIERLCAAHPDAVVGVKDSAGDWSHTEALLRDLGALSVFSGTEEHLLGSLRLGGPGCISAAFNIYPELGAELFAGWQAPDAGERQAVLSALRRILGRHAMVPALKALLARRDGDPGWARVRPPLVALEGDGVEGLVRELGQAGWRVERQAQFTRSTGGGWA